VKRAHAAAAEALALFDRLPVVATETLIGRWRGESYPTGHPLDGLLEAWGWLGKQVDGRDHVYPLVFRSLAGRPLQLRPLAPRAAVALARHVPLLKAPALGRIGRMLLPLLATRRPLAHVSLVTCRGHASAAIVYDRVPVRDVFRQLERDVLLGLMDLDGEPGPPYFFVLRRET
jgi:hypothetical protein